MDEAEKLQIRLSEALSRLDQAVADRLQSSPAVPELPELSELQRRTDQVSERLDKAIKQLNGLLGD